MDENSHIVVARHYKIEHCMKKRAAKIKDPNTIQTKGKTLLLIYLRKRQDTNDTKHIPHRAINLVPLLVLHILSLLGLPSLLGFLRLLCLLSLLRRCLDTLAASSRLDPLLHSI